MPRPAAKKLATANSRWTKEKEKNAIKELRRKASRNRNGSRSISAFVGFKGNLEQSVRIDVKTGTITHLSRLLIQTRRK